MGSLIRLPLKKKKGVGDEVDIDQLFPKTYEASRTRFKEHFSELKEIWPDAELLTHPLSVYPGISIDWIQSAGRQANEKMLLFTTGEHGIEGYVGSAMLEYFIQNYVPKLNPDTTGITLVHMIDPWGMKYRRRTNPNNVDLNRNFVWDINQIDGNFNPGYDAVKNFLGPQRILKNMRWENLVFFLKYLDHLTGIGNTGFWNAKILGQYSHPLGIHYGGMEVQEEVEVVKMIYRQAFETCSRLLQLDMHTGYGPRYQMTLVNSVLESKSSAEFKSQADYPRVAAMNPEEFYEVRGDMIDYVYMLREKEFPEVALYATSFEFGTFGLSHWQRFRSMRAMVQENQVYWYGARTKGIKSKVRKEFLESFSPSSVKWKRKAVTDADQAFRGILKMEGYI
jgi:hypothetical protein